MGKTSKKIIIGPSWATIRYLKSLLKQRFLKIRRFTRVMGEKMGRSEPMSVAFIFKPKQICVPNFIKLSQRLRPVSWTQKNLNIQQMDGQTGILRSTQKVILKDFNERWVYPKAFRGIAYIRIPPTSRVGYKKEVIILTLVSFHFISLQINILVFTINWLWLISWITRILS